MEQAIHPRQQRPALVIILTLAAVFLGFQIIGPLVGFFIALPFYDGTLTQMADGLQNPAGDEKMKTVYFIMQGCGTLFGLIVVPTWIYQRYRHPVARFFAMPIYLQGVVMVVVVVVVFMVVNSVAAAWNENVTLPDWARSTEDKLRELTKFLTTFDTPGEFVMALVVIAVLPAVGEELVFRGILQREFFLATRNIHLSIWVSAIIFSAIHMQFFGFVPRLLLGALFGYLFYWSGSLPMAILAHFVNNAFTVTALYLYQRGLLDIDFDIESTEPAPWPAVVGSALATAVLLYAFKKFFDSRRPAPPPETPPSF